MRLLKLKFIILKFFFLIVDVCKTGFNSYKNLYSYLN